MLIAVLAAGILALAVPQEASCQKPDSPALDSQATPLRPTIVQLKWKHQFQFAGYYAAKELGYYREIGLDVTLREAKPELDITRELLEGRADFLVHGSNPVADYLRGEPIMALAMFFQHSPAVLLAAADSGIRNATDLAGKRLMLVSAEAPEILAMLATVRGAAQPYIPIPSTWRPEDLADGVADAISAYSTNEPYRLDQIGFKYRMIRPVSHGVDFYGDGLFTTRSLVEKTPGLARDFRAASIRGWRYAMDNPAQVIAWILERYAPEADPGNLRYEALTMRELILPDLVELGHMSSARWAHIGDIYATLGLVPPDPDLSGFLYSPATAPDLAWLRRLGAASVVLLIVLLAVAAGLLIYNARLRGRLVRQMEDLTRANEGLRAEVAVRRHAEEALRQSEERNRELFEKSESLMLVVNHTGIVLDVNEKALTDLGFRKEEVLGSCALDFARPEDRDRIADLIAKSYDRIPVPPSEFEVHTPAGTRSLIFSEGPATILQRNGEDVLLVSALDVTDLIQARRALQESEERFALAVAGSADGIWDWDILQDEIYYSDRLKELLGYEPDEIENRVKSIREHIHPEDENRLWDVLKAHLAQGTAFDCEFRLRTKSGDYRWFRGRGQALWDAHGKPFRMAGSVQDVTPRKDAEAVRENLEKQLRQAQKMEAIGQLAGGVAHDFNNLLQAIQGYTTLARRTLDEGHAAHDDLAEVERAATRAAVLVRQLLAFSRQEQFRPRPVDLNDVVTGLLKMLGRLIGEHIELRFVQGMGMGSIMADPGQVEQVLVNLCVNARDAMPKGGGITIRTEKTVLDQHFCDRHAWSREGAFVVISVKDEGPGIPESIRDRIFEPFFTTKDVGAGTGLGLATVYGVVKQHDGLIEVRSSEHDGAEFRIYFPCSARTETGLLQEGEDRPETGSGTETILLAEDDELIRELTMRILEKAGYKVLVAHDGAEAIEHFSRFANEIDAVLLDVVMPKKSGPEVAALLRETLPGLPVLFMSGYSGNYFGSRFTPDTRTQLVQKPLKPVDLLRALRNLLDDHGAHAR